MPKIKFVQIAFFVSYNLFLMFIYGVCLYINTQGKDNFLPRLTIDYLAKAILILPFYWLIFVRLRQRSIRKRLLLHFIICPMYVRIWLFSYHFVCDMFKIGYMTGIAQVWDVYIPFLIYISQFSIFHIYEYYENYQNQLIKESDLAKAKLNSELIALKAQINPHFLYNIFNTINASIPIEQENTRELIAKLSDLFRYQLRFSQEDWVTIREEVDFLQKYLELEQARFSERLEIFIDVEKGIENTLIPPLILQPIVENAVKHAIAPLISKGKIEILIYKKEILKNQKNIQKIHFSIKDTGKKLENFDNLYNNKGIGLKNTRLRLEKLYNETLHFEALNPQGLEVWFSLVVRD